MKFVEHHLPSSRPAIGPPDQDRCLSPGFVGPRGTCRRLRSYPDLNRIHCTLLDADNPGVRADMQRRFGDLAVPRTLISRSVVSGLDTAKIQRLCR